MYNKQAKTLLQVNKEKAGNSFFLWSKYLIHTLHMLAIYAYTLIPEIPMWPLHIIKCSASFLIRERQIKISKGYTTHPSEWLGLRMGTCEVLVTTWSEAQYGLVPPPWTTGNLHQGYANTYLCGSRSLQGIRSADTGFHICQSRGTTTSPGSAA